MVEFVNDRIFCMILRYYWFDIAVLILHVQTEAIPEDAKNGFHWEPERAFNKFPKHHMKTFLGYFDAEVGEEAIFKPVMWNEFTRN
jgi:hypothetical protein